MISQANAVGGPAQLPLCEPFEFGDDPTAVYWLYGADGVLLYVGITLAPAVRMAQHAVTQPWWPEVAKKTMVWYSDREAAAAAETAAIRAEKPRYNIKMSSTASSARLSRQQITDRLRQEFLDDLAAAYEAGQAVPIGGGGQRVKLTPENRVTLSIS